MFSNDRKIILLADDDPVNLKLARNTLMDTYDVFTMPSAEKMFQFLEQKSPDLILLDVLMPGTSGYSAIKILKQDPRTREIPVIFLTSQSDSGSELKGFNLGAVDYISKPFSPQLLLKRVEVHLLVDSQKTELQYLNNNLQHLVNEKTSEVLSLQNAVVKTMSNLVEYRDDVTGEHVERTETYLHLLMQEMIRRNIYTAEIQSWDLDLIFRSAQLHDVGKIAIRDNILLKPGKLSPDEFEEMKKHTTFGETIIDTIQKSAKKSMFLTHAKIMAGTHHEKWDGTGYPGGLSGLDIPLEGRLMALADVYDALISTRPYKPAMSSDKALGIMASESGRHFDPVLVDIFVASISASGV
jgi:putative two-component system response regulator